MRGVRWGRIIALGLSGLLIVALLASFLPLGPLGMMGSAHHWGMSHMWLGPAGWLFMALGWLIPLGLLGLLALCLAEPGTDYSPDPARRPLPRMWTPNANRLAQLPLLRADSRTTGGQTVPPTKTIQGGMK
jgi:hypothetical protein